MIIGLDVGNGSIGMGVRNKDAVLYATMPSVYGRVDNAQQVLSVSGKPKQQPDVFSLGAETFVLGYDNVRAIHSTPIGAYDREQRFESAQFETLSKLALLDAATRNGQTGVLEVDLVFGTPAEDYTPRTRDIVQQWFATPVTGAKNGQHVVVMVQRIEVTPQPFAVFIDAYVTDDGFVDKEEMESEDILVIDSGSGTLDLSEIHRLELSKQSSIPAGLNDVYQRILDLVQRREPKVYATTYDLEHQLRAQDGASQVVFEYGRVKMDITKFKEQAMQHVWDRMQQGIQHRYPDRSMFKRVLLAGGSGDAFRDYFVKWMPGIEVMPAPQLSVARGLMKYGILQFGDAHDH